MSVNGEITFRLRGSRQQRRPLAECLAVPFENAEPIRRFSAHKGMPNRHVFAAFSKMDRLVPCESLHEFRYLKYADFEGEVVRVASQPFRVDWQSVDGESSWHVPDFFALLLDGGRRVIDVTDEKRLAKEPKQSQVAFMRGLCLRAGWSYAVFTGLPSAFATNLDALNVFRRRPWSYNEYAAQVLRFLREPRSFAELYAIEPSAAVMPVVFHLIWLRVLSVEMNVQWTTETVVGLASPPSEA